MSGGINRREAMIYGGSALLSALVPAEKLARLEAAQRSTKTKMKRLIYLWGDGGGPSLPDFCDPKNSPRVHSLYDSVGTGVQDLRLAMPFSGLAAGLEQAVVFKTRVGEGLEHIDAIPTALRRDPSTGQHLLSRIAKANGNLPHVHAESPRLISAKNYRKYGFSVHLGVESHWNSLTQRYSVPSYGTAQPGLLEKNELLRNLEFVGGRAIEGPEPDHWHDHRESALQILSQARKTSLSLPEEDVRRYSGGGEACPATMLPLFARELIRERLASVVFVRTGYHEESGGFDMHTNLPYELPDAAARFSTSVAALLEDYRRGLLEDTVIVYDTEFGRTSRLNKDAGRDHAPYHAAFIVGEAYQKGSVVGRTDNDCEPVDQPITNEDFASIVLQGVTDSPDFALRGKLPTGIFSGSNR